MAISRNNKVTKSTFSGAGRLYSKNDRGLAAAIHGILQNLGRRRIKAKNITAFTDNSAGVRGATFTVNTTTEVVTVTSGPNHGLVTGDGPFQFEKTGMGVLPGGIVAATNYWVRVLSASTFTLHTTKAGAVTGGTPVNITTTGTTPFAMLMLAPLPAITSNDLTGLTTGATAASINIGADTVMDAYATVVEQINKVRAELGMGSLGTGPGALGAGTIAVIDDTVAANGGNTDAASYASVIPVFNDLLTMQSTVAAAVNEIRMACGLAKVEGPQKFVGKVRKGLDLAAISDAANHANPPVAAVLLAHVDAALDVLADNVAFLASRVDNVTAVADDMALLHYAG